MAYNDVWSLDEIYDNFFRKGGWDPAITQLTYSFPTTRPSGYSALSGDGKHFSAFSLEQRSWAQYAMQTWDDLIDINIVYGGLNDDGDLRLMNTKNYDGGTAHAKSPDNKNFGDVWVHSNKTSNFDLGLGKNSVKTLIHEIGHALGLQHPGSYDASKGPSNYIDDARYYQDSQQYTIMSYFSASHTGGYLPSAPQTPMLHDILAVQSRYGINWSTRSGDTTYGFGSNAGNAVYDFTINDKPALAIWDAHGTDELSLSGATSAVTLDLRPGHFSSALGGTDNIAIAYYCWIENARGGSANDKITGNSKANVLRGLDGNDTLKGLEGKDSLHGGHGNDNVQGGDGGDYLTGSSGDDRLYGQTGADELHGGTGSDSLYGWTGNDTLWGESGNDYLDGRTGLDTFFGGSGRDTVYLAYSSDDWVVDLDPDNGPGYGNNLNGGTELFHSVEAVKMGSGKDTVYGTEGANEILGGHGSDRLHGLGGNDTVDGQQGNDTVYRTAGDNYLIGGAGVDLIDYGTTTHAINVSLHNQFSQQLVVDLPGTASDEYDHLKQFENLNATIYDDTVKGSHAIGNTINGQSGDDRLYGSGGNNDLFGGYGDDTLFSGVGDDTLGGGIGFDFASYDTGTYAGGITIDLAIASGQSNAGFGTDVLVSIQGLYGTGYVDHLFGNSSPNVLEGLASSDVLDGRGGNDTLFGDAGHDTLVGGSGNDRLDGDAGSDSMSGGSGSDTLYGGASGSGQNTLDGGQGNDTMWGDDGPDLFLGGPGNDDIRGAGGADTIDFSGSFGGVEVDLADTLPQGVSLVEGIDIIRDIESAFGSSNDDTLRGTDGSNYLNGLAGNDMLEGRAGNDVIIGEMGYDTASFASASAGVRVDLAITDPQNTQGAGVDTFISIEALLGSAHDDLLAGDLVANLIYGSNGNDWLFGRQGNDTLNGGLGDDLLLGGIGDDSISGAAGEDMVSYFFAGAGVTVSLAVTGAQNTGGDGIDAINSVEHLTGSFFDDSLTGNDGANNIVAGQGNDTLTGNDGDDTLRGGEGQDLLNGGPGQDNFDFDDVIDSAPDTFRDHIADFSKADDTIDVSGIDANSGVGDDQAFVFIGASAFSGVAGELRSENVRSTSIVYADTTGDGIADFSILVENVNGLTSGDFVL